MTLKSALQKGFQLVLHHILVIPVFYLVNLIVVLLLAIPFYVNINNSLGDKAARETMMRGFDVEWADHFAKTGGKLAETLRASISGPGMFLDNFELFIRGSFNQFGVFVLCLGLLYLTLNSFMLAGLLGTYHDEKRKFSMGRFFQLSGSYFNRFFSLTATAAIVYFIFYKLITLPILHLFENIGDSLMTERNAFWIGLIGVFLAFFFLTIINIIFDYAKIVVIKENKRSAWEAIWIGLKFIAHHPAKVLGIYYALILFTSSVIIVFLVIQSVINQTGVLLVILGLLLHQVFIVAKIWTRFNFYGCQLEYYRAASETGLPRKKKL